MLPLPCPCMTRTSCFMLRITPGDGGGAPDAGESTGNQNNLSAHSTSSSVGPPETRQRFGGVSYLFHHAIRRRQKWIWLIPTEP
jgi:hypothetical protein